MDQALATNTTLKSLRIDIDTADINARLVHESVSEIKVDFIDSVGTAQNKYVSDAKSQLAKKLNALSYTATESKIKLSVQKAYYDLVNAQSQLELKKQSLTRAQTQLKVANASVAVGTRAKTDVLQAEMGVSGAQAALVSAENAVEVARLTLNQTMGVDLSKQWVLTDKDKMGTVTEMPLEEATAKAIKDRVEMAQRQGDVDVAQLNYDLIAKYSAASTYNGQIAKNDIAKAKLAIEDQKTKITMEVTQNYFNLNAAKKAVEFNQKAKESAAESYRLTNLRFENGLATTLEVIQAEEELTTKENQYQDALHQYHLAAMNYQTSIGE
ncbi:TolC family protein [Brevibacillus fluminis]|uniref:TolC family protein n=2 Tax=Brevibacillus fluminis TaxID=511487 RepID=A0A3M8DYT0_9BACL|nr:TolC family protein [Brevibacillus fluminis]